jgi:hypothetical protein
VQGGRRGVGRWTGTQQQEEGGLKDCQQLSVKTLADGMHAQAELCVECERVCVCARVSVCLCA